ncbi:MAG TPA: sigma-70 family RNA polymerase sigma factor [Candidatus Hydrogenedentes bacterium]|nr:sigma-70 family RNA polymerase sigma factor [Candidatus Hydrogenedentota bacterium]HPU99271.1 sigma-70 family RNA polymerase sigma factor [Candidatus Hydrogenedentota bacterium]
MCVERTLSDRENLSDAELVRAAQQGQHEAFETLVRRHYQMVLNTTWRYLRNQEDAWDVAQETFIKAQMALGQFNDSGHPDGFRAWLVRIAANKSLDLIRRKTRQAEVPINLWDNGEEVLPIPGPQSTEREVHLRDINSVVRQCMDQLPPDLRMTLMLREINQLSYEDIAEATGVPVGTVMSRLYNARKKMRALLKQKGVSDFL